MNTDESQDEIKRRAGERGARKGLPYAGALLPAEAHALMRAGAKLVDVRTRAELDWVGRVPGALYVEWNDYPGGRPNPSFLEQLGELADRDETLMFLCRSGGRSHNAAALATQAGWRECFNVLEGFEGDKDAEGHRGSVGGWKVARLPWVQG
ncbi:MAG TPA: rhodanese-like domain-containing protein [Burkholderiales bacterium]|nr:rhodanese-like domain-containing protein [Burkholderiales bacterium]